MKALLVQFILCVICSLGLPTVSLAAGSDGSAAGSGKNIETTFGGQVKLLFTGTDYEDGAIQSEFKDDAWFNSGLNLRIKSRTFFNDNLSFDCHYLFTSSLGDSMEASRFFVDKYAGTPDTLIAQIFKKNNNDDRGLMDLSSRIKEEGNYFLYHRIDRLNFSLYGDSGRITIGREAVTWGNGFIFNPMDIFNPFSPYDTDRDYKKGEDMVFFETYFKEGDDFQFFCVPGRDLKDGDIKFSKSSFGAKYHLFLNGMEFDFMAARHYKDTLAGAGCVGTLGNAVWRSDIIYTFAGGDMEEDYLSFIVNIDYSWVWCKKNFYGFSEYHYSGIGTDDYSEAFSDYDLFTRISRGEIYGLGKNYLSSGIIIELNPLVNFNFTAIANLNDPSYMLQPEIIWDMAQNIEITIGSSFALGGKDDEYGQIQIPFSIKEMDYGKNLFLWITMFF
ncbi:MAG: hypothetical protein U9N77_14650 [Thermodesulfobacteriota bacterium]|nr:hypothetical protein [Thermodesulfobacteriota bacterium]